MKTWCIYLIIFPYVSFTQIKDDSTILINSLNFRATTTISVPCENFEMQFRNRISINKVTARDSITLMNKFIKTLRFSKKDENVDVRAKMVYKIGDTPETIICMDGYAILVNGKLIKRNKAFSKFILSMIPKEQLKFYR